MGVTQVSGTMRIATGLGLMAVVIWMGYEQRSLWCLAIAGPAFTVSFVTGKLRAWRYAASVGKMKSALAGLPATLLIQTILVGLLYLIGFGVGAIARRNVDIQPFGQLDWALPLIAGLIGAVAGIAIDQLEGKPDTAVPIYNAPDKPSLYPEGDDEDSVAPRFDREILEGPVTPESFYNGIHYSHGTYTPREGTGSDYDGTPNEKSLGRTPQQIAEHEARLQRPLPEGLKALYAVQNGGSVNDVCWPRPGVSGPCSYEDMITPFSGYNDLYPIETIRTVYDSTTDFADPESDADQFPGGCLNMLILAQWYRETLFLDYNEPGAPRVGFVDFDHADDWAEKCVWWPDFETFFAELRHYRDV